MHEIDLIHIHEDDWGQHQLHPLAAWDEARADLERAAAAGERNRAPDGSFTDIYLTKQPSLDYRALALSVDRVKDALAPHLPLVRRFYATAVSGFDGARDPMGSYDDSPVCYGFDLDCFVKVEVEGALVRSIWYQSFTSDRARLDALRAAFLAIDRLSPSILVDYALEVSGRLDDAAFLDRYFALFVGPAIDQGAPRPLYGDVQSPGVLRAITDWWARLTGR